MTESGVGAGRTKSAGSTSVQGRRLTRSATALQPLGTRIPEFDSSTPLPSHYQPPPLSPPPPSPPSPPPPPPPPPPAVTVRSALATSYPNLARKAVGFRVTRRHFVKRFQYTISDDLAILNYLLEHNLIDKVNLRSTWRQLERHNVTSHSAESMRVRVLRSLVHQLPSLLPNTEQETIDFLRSCLLTGSLNNYKPADRPPISVTPPRPLRLRNPRTAAAVPSADASVLTLPRSVDAASSLSQSRATLGNIHTQREVTVAPSPSLSFIVSSTAFAVRSVDDICRRFPFLRSSDVHLLLCMTGGSLSAVEALLRKLTPHSSASCGGGGGITSNGSAPDNQSALWLPDDDCHLLSTDKAKVAEVIDRFGLEEVLWRISYLTGRGFHERAGGC
ncbi:unnamed protein product [Schistocephalus solidus]|uniref:Telomeric repeat-binding factor 2-interacting protein 1 n=1 Tax=Schistocephalus solidus TaxID=70667 RepID=A0A183TAS4_SCHSO|nr:unnamed protein product [Schistocephalus solidus]